MTFHKILLGLALPAAFAAVATAAPPTQVGDTFISVNYQTLPGYVTDQRNDTMLFYLGADGSCKQIYEQDEALGLVFYSPTATGTYTFVPTAGNPNEAVLRVSFPDVPEYNQFTLTFTTDTAGSVALDADSIGTSSFYMLLPAPNQFLANVSNRVTLRPADSAITGFVIGGSANRLVLVRAVGPGLAQFGVDRASANPTLQLFSGSSLVATGQKWEAVTGYDAQAVRLISGLVGAFALQPGSNDTVFFGSLAPGAYTVQGRDTTAGASGATVLMEVYILPYSG